MNAPRCADSRLLLALGIISAPDYATRRTAQRASWGRWPNVGADQPICPIFVVRAGSAPPRVARRLEREQAVAADTLLLRSVAYNETRVRGPLLSLAAWFSFAERELRHARFFGKLDDDAYLHAPDLESLLRTAATLEAPNVYLGALTWYHWYPRIFETTRHGWTFAQAAQADSRSSCRTTPLRPVAPPRPAGRLGAAEAQRAARSEAVAAFCGPSGCGTCVGPFAFASGFLIVLSQGLLGEIVTGGGLDSDAQALRHMDVSRLPDKKGRPQESVMEDVWLGSLLYRFPPKAPISYVSLFGGRQSAGLVVDQWDFRMTRAALLCHVITKQPNRLLALHDLVQQPGNHCPRSFRLRCSPDCSTRPEATAGPRKTTASDCGRPNRWCVVERKPRPHDACCSDEGGTNRSCSATFGSNAWPKRYEAAWQRALASSSSRPRRRDAT